MLDPPLVVSTVSKIENGERRLSNLQIVNFAEVLGCEPESIPVVSGRDKPVEVQRWQAAQQAAIEQSVESGAAAIGYVLAQLRKKNGKTMQHVAQAIGVTISVYHRIEMASRMIQEDEIKALANFFDLPESKLIKMFEQRSRDNLEQLKKGVPEQLLPRFPRALLKEDAKWGQLGALERYAMRGSLRVVPGMRRNLPLPVYGRTKLIEGDAHPAFVIDPERAIDQVRIEDLFEGREDCFLVRNHSTRLGFLMRVGALAFVDPAATAAVGDIVFFVRRDGTADSAVVVGDGLGAMKLKMYGPEEEIPLADDSVARVYRVGGVIFAR
jgi:transcriptional regulator with XRE-family HTH domain